MAWVKLDDQFFRNPKIVAAGRDARDLYMASLCYSASALTDGVIAQSVLRILGAEADIDDVKNAAGRLVECGLWDIHEKGFRIHDYVKSSLMPDQTTQEQRNCWAYVKWRRAVLVRDGYCCVECGSADELHAHHIKEWALFEQHRFDVSNGLTLCEPCHQRVHGKGAV